MADNIYIAHIRAGSVANQLLVAHAYRCSGADPVWERHALEAALKDFDSLSSVMADARDRLAAIRQAEGGE